MLRAPHATRRDVSTSLATALAGQLLLVISGVLLARTLGAVGRGQLAIIVLVPSLLSQLGTFGVPLALTFHIARDEVTGARLVRSLRKLVYVQAVVLTVAVAAVFAFVAEPDETTAMLAAVPVMPALIAQQYGLAILQGRQRFIAFNVLRIAPAGLFALFVCALVTVDAASLLELVVVWTAANVIVAIPLAGLARSFVPDASEHQPSASLRDVVGYGARAFVGSTSPSEVLRIDQAIVALSLSRKALGLYVVALAFVNLPRFMSQSIGMVAYPRIAAARPRRQASLVRKYVALVAVVSGTVVVAMELAVESLLPAVFGHEFSGAVVTAQILLVAAFLLALRRVLTDASQGLGRPGAGSVAELINLAVTLPLIALAAPRYGIEGAAVAVAAGAALSLASLAFVVRRTLRDPGLGPRSDGDAPRSGVPLALDQGIGQS